MTKQISEGRKVCKSNRFWADLHKISNLFPFRSLQTLFLWLAVRFPEAQTRVLHLQLGRVWAADVFFQWQFIEQRKTCGSVLVDLTCHGHNSNSKSKRRTISVSY